MNAIPATLTVWLALSTALVGCNATMPAANSTTGSTGTSTNAFGQFVSTLVETRPTAAGPDSSRTSTDSKPKTPAATGSVAALARDTSAPERAGVSAAAKQVSTGPRASESEIKSMLIRADPKACSATSDASFEDTVLTYTNLFAGITADLLNTKAQSGDKALQAKLNDMRPVMRELARNTNWMPISTERLFGDQIVAYNKLEEYTPKRGPQKKMLEQTVTPMFEQFKRYAREDLKSDYNFEMRVFDDPGTAPSMIAGGIMLVPSGLLNALTAVEKPDLLVAFMFSHEFSHALRRHKTKKLQMSIVDSMILASEFRKIYDAQAGVMSRLRNGVDSAFKFTSFNVQSLVAQTCKAHNWLPLMEQGQEFEADVCGALLLERLGEDRKVVYRPVDGYQEYIKSGLAAAATKEAEKAEKKGNASGPGDCFITEDHPSANDRLANLKAYTIALDEKSGRSPMNASLNDKADSDKGKPASPRNRQPPSKKPATN
jgi:hypothetical protein